MRQSTTDEARRMVSRKLTSFATIAVTTATGALRALPGYVVIGEKRCGTTSLNEYIQRHPQVRRGRLGKGTHYFDVNYHRGWAWFRSCFPIRRAGTLTGEASPFYLFHPLAMERLAAVLPETKLIAILREPAARTYSHYRTELRIGQETLTVEEALDREPARLAGEAMRMRRQAGYESRAVRHHSYLARSRYADQLERVYSLFSPEQVLVVQTEALMSDPDSVLARVWQFLGLEPHPVGGRVTSHAGSYDPMPPALAERLGAYFHEHNERLYRLPGIDFRWPAPAGLGIPGATSR